MQLEQIVLDGVLADAGVLALLGRNLFLVQLPQDAFSAANNPPYTGGPPRITARACLQRISTERIYAHASANNAGWSRFQFTIWDYKGLSALNIATAIIAAVRTFTASPEGSPPTPAAPNFVLDQRLEVEPQTQPPIFKVRLDVRFFFQDQ